MYVEVYIHGSPVAATRFLGFVVSSYYPMDYYLLYSWAVVKTYISYME